MTKKNFTKTASACISFGIGLVAATSAFSAESAKDVLAKYGMLGKWAYDCSQPASVANYKSVFEEQANGEVRRTFLDGPDHIYNDYRIVRARVQNDNTLWIELFSLGRDKTHLTNIIELKENKYRVLHSEIVNGPALINDNGYTRTSSKFTGVKNSTGQTPPSSEKCD